MNIRENMQNLQLHLRETPGYLFIKRVMDLCGALVGLIFLSPLFLLISIIIKLNDPEGPIFFKQNRVGKNGEQFRIYKFRSMVHHAEDLLDDLLDKNESSGAMFKIKNDPRVTQVGRFLRKTSLDEFPQLLNVLKGEMSLVGPRPPLLREVQQYSQYDKQRLLVKPGCTGLWQVEARSSVGFETMVELDIEYIKKRSTLFDIKIMIKTLFIIFHSKNSY
ncbi:sugar transferase [Sporolactobacillus kofuensis]|uniref:Sugar transferase n=1 Tax=Sporolactobacillus kofuensis TaxID=269672 RepID=A0ABW1WGY0_9BACL|nr:sugar transferase [Sporolactobacillus kofuensis]MCO7176716.1 sugar transferase [Sporolactobacillus kofuensis]